MARGLYVVVSLNFHHLLPPPCHGSEYRSKLRPSVIYHRRHLPGRNVSIGFSSVATSTISSDLLFSKGVWRESLRLQYVRFFCRKIPDIGGAYSLSRMIRRNKRAVFSVRANQGFNFNGGGGGGGGKYDSNTVRMLGNLALAIGLTYLSMSGQLGWVLDAIVSIWLLAALLPIAGLGAFLWFAGRDIVQDSCPNCGNEFQIFKSSLRDGVQLCPFCSQPFSVQGNKFVRESAKFSSNYSESFGQMFNDFSVGSEKGRTSSTTVVDIEAEVKDID